MTEFSEKQVHIMEAAEKLFAARGYEGTPIRDIADAAEVNLAMISYYFGSKEKLMEALFEYRGSFFKLKLETMLNDTQLDPWQKIESIIDQYIDRLMTKPDFYRIMTREQMESSNEMVKNKIIEIKTRNIGLIEAIIKQGQDQKLFRPEVDVHLLMMTIVGTVSQLLTTARFYQILSNQTDISEQEFREKLRKKMSLHLKQIYKAILFI